VDLINIGAAALLISSLIFIHELGHFLFAKAFGVGVKSFSIGFGRRILGFVHNGTDYKICILPFGGYVLMEGADPFLDEDEMEEEKASSSSLLVKPIWQRLLIVGAGPLFNLLLPVVLFTGLYMSGEPRPAPIVGEVQSGSMAEAAGFEVDDLLLSFEGQPLTFWMEIYPLLDGADPKAPVHFRVKRGEVEREVVLNPPDKKSFSWSAWAIGFDDRRPSTRIGVDDPASPAGQAGLQLGDELLAVNRVPVADFSELMRVLQATSGAAELELERDGKTLSVQLATNPTYAGVNLEPALGETAGDFVDPLANAWGIYPSTVFIESILEDSASEKAGLNAGARIAGIDGSGIATWSGVTGRISNKQVGEGIESSAKPVEVLTIFQGKAQSQALTPKVTKDTDALGRYRYRAMIGIGGGGKWVTGPMNRKYFGAKESLSMATRDTKLLVGLTLGQIGKLLTGKAAPSKSLGGPVQIFRDAGAAAKQGAHTWWRMMAVLSISLAIVNFLPVPVLDGGQFLFFLVEGIRGRPVSLRFRERAQQIGVLLLVALMLMVLVFDIGRIFGKG
jgi:regulator of sigma E protease